MCCNNQLLWSLVRNFHWKAYKANANLSGCLWLVIHKSLCCKISQSMRLIFSKIGFIAQLQLRQWRRKWLVVSISWPQLQIGFKQSWKLCLNLWSAKWLKPSLILVSSFKPSKSWVEEILFGSGLINFSIRFLDIWHKEELWILMSRLFHLVITAGKKEWHHKQGMKNHKLQKHYLKQLFYL